MPMKSHFSSKVIREANALLVASGGRMEIPLPRELTGIITSTRKTRSELNAAFESAHGRLRKE
ncbi:MULTISPECIES: hypothetical protein [unclassified Pseudomonas]|uniref:hypothetical protein n=1 Tax=unclassified Pseudomonas TaxID=196821 RepID=UPI00128ECA8F|nr:hypothetical protein [Pseudomonas sp. MN1F]MQG96113.1 hypothetical protein [Pseudomonas sp. MN1F]